MTQTLAVFFLLLFFIPAQAQDLTGIWRGYFITEGADNYKFELQIEQSPSKRIIGVSYSYLSTVFYGKATLTGFYNTSEKNALIQEIKTVELRMSGASVACIMKCNFTYTRSGNEEFLEGTYESFYEQTEELLGIKKGGDCGGGKIFLRKVPTSDFYVEPFLREKLVQKQNNTKPPVTRTTPPPANKTITKAPATKPPVKKETAAKPKEDTVKKITQVPTVQMPKKEPERPALTIPQVTRSRKNELTQTVNVSSEEIIIRLYDNGEIDGDTISVYHNNQLVLQNKRLTAAPITLNLKMSEENSEHVLVLVAENLGRIPPNTSLMIVQDGNKRYEVRITSTEQKNAMVRFRYVK
ncbi:MAG: hypothetical protein ACO1NX_06060 [Chitinophagaceae bacterium]